MFASQVHALGLSPPEEEIGYLPVGSTQTISATISRSVDELNGDIYVTVTPRKSAAEFFHGDLAFTIQEGIREYTYLYNIIPENPSDANQELYVTFLLQPATTTTSWVGVISGVTQVVRFTTDVVASGRSSSGGGSSHDSTTLSDDDEEQDESQTLEETSPSSETQLDETQESETDLEQEDSTQNEVEQMPEEPVETQNEQSIQEEAIAELNPTEDVLTQNVSQIVDIQSSSHPSEEEFYRGSGIMLSWLPPGKSIETTFYFLLTTQSSVPSSALINQTKNPSIYYEGLADGIYYFHILDSSDPEQKIFTRRIQIDNTPPSVDLNITIHKPFILLPKRRFLTINVTDVLSGVEDMQVKLNGIEAEVGQDGISLRGYGFGEYPLEIVALDKAGNERLAEFVIKIAPRYPVAKTVDWLLSLPRILFSKLFAL